MATASHTEAGPPARQSALEGATLAFQNVLDDDQRRALLMMRQGSVPDAGAILMFTAQLDSINKNRKGRSFATPLHRFLTSIRDFCGIIDTYVSAHPEIAALVWGSVKLTMMVVANFASYYEAASNLFTALGDLCPLFSEYHILFYGSAGLRHSLDNFYASIIRCCGHVVMTIQRSWATQLLKALQSSFDQEFKSDLEDVQRHARKVKSQIALAKAQTDKRFQELQEKERVKASEGRAIVERHITRTDCSLDTLQSFHVQINREKSRKRARKLLDSLSTYNYSRSFSQSTRKRHGNTTNWIHGTPQFQRWLDGESSVIWCSGKIGCGKTIAAAGAIERVQRLISIADTPLITYLFMQTDDGDSLKADLVLRALLRQLLDETMASGELGDALHKIVLSWDPSAIASLFLKLMAAPQKAYVFIDGLDECDRETRRLLFEVLSAIITAAGNIHLYLSSRDSVGDDITKYFPGYEHISLDCEATRHDIACYINDAIDEKLEEGDLTVGTDELVGEIKDSLANGAQGMYLWAYFQIKEICLQISDKDIRQALQDLPQDLAEVFRRVLRHINLHRRGSVARKIFPWVAAAKRPLTMGELREAIAIEIGQQFTNPSKLCNDMGKVSSWCENLIEIDEETDSVQFAHSAVRAFLVDAASDSTLADFHFELEAVDHNIGELCVTYLNFNDFKRTIAVRQNPIQINPSLIAPTVLGPVSRSAALISGLMTDINSTHAPDLYQESSNIFPVGSSSRAENLKISHPFLEYASTYWISHTKQFRQRRSKTWALWESIVVCGHVLAKTPWNASGRTLGKTKIDAQAPLVRWACSNNHSAIIHLLMSHRPYSLDDAAFSCDLKLFDILLKEHMAEYEVPKNLVNQAFRTAVALGRLDMVDRLLSTQLIDLGAPLIYKSCRNALEIALEEHTHLLSSLLASESAKNIAKADLNAIGRKTGKTALQLATEKGQLNWIDILLSSGADVEAKGSTGEGPLHIATQMGHLEVIKLLLSAGADVNTKSPTGEGPFHTAAQMGHLEVIKLLLSAGADVNTKDSTGQGPLHIAVKAGHLELVKLLLSARADFEAKDPKGQRPLHIAAQMGYLGVMKLLLSAGADIETQDSRGQGRSI
ncbi:hypothetical protein PG991_007701 [Apiospora marii]|uniref:NACHT domain-containing protein n=1 Tax=Apiospora marii TaxID=335849 RepID=A0ABR1RU70_9PEZI